MEAAGSSEMFVFIYQTAMRHIQDDRNLHINLCKNLKSLQFTFSVFRK
jgi:hypothetical protein